MHFSTWFSQEHTVCTSGIHWLWPPMVYVHLELYMWCKGMECPLFSVYDAVTCLYLILLHVNTSSSWLLCMRDCTCVRMSSKQVTLKESVKVRYAKSFRAAASRSKRNKLQRLKHTQSVFQHAWVCVQCGCVFLHRVQLTFPGECRFSDCV